MISDRYRDQNAALHRAQHAYGTSGSKWGADVLAFCAEVGAADVLDYGCGKQTLRGMIDHVFTCRGYDPAIPHLAAEPAPADVVACTDVMEHVEPQFTDAVLGHVFSLARLGVFFVISTERGGRKLPDGRFAHLVVKPAEWWLERLARHAKRLQRMRERSSTSELVIRAYARE